MLPIVDWAIRYTSFALRVFVNSVFTRVFAEYDRYCSTYLQLIFHEVYQNFSHCNANKFYQY
ncbi:MAG: hypothetical protein RMZ43_019780 [Nostoc sp. CmiVER01]|uniref:hypothetical protein n=1 Tax=Nostoc sp. CmiVER01 TaxID=3075384 RepID=UPI002AD39D4A|nr:hypothetical protein [Nostoc sp. CmiVER01]MDZ8125743.1 hypothetical protein [Nostoc sp. CmiVER01]